MLRRSCSICTLLFSWWVDRLARVFLNTLKSVIGKMGVFEMTVCLPEVIIYYIAMLCCDKTPSVMVSWSVCTMHYKLGKSVAFHIIP